MILKWYEVIKLHLESFCSGNPAHFHLEERKSNWYGKICERYKNIFSALLNWAKQREQKFQSRQYLGSISWAQVRTKFHPNLGGIFPPSGKLISWTFFGRKFISVETKFCPNFYSSLTLQNLFPPRWISAKIIKDAATNIQKRECRVKWYGTLCF
jgi:hypothetical protein